MTQEDIHSATSTVAFFRTISFHAANGDPYKNITIAETSTS